MTTEDRNAQIFAVTPAEADVHGAAIDMYMLYIMQHGAWRNPWDGAVSPAASAFFEATPPGESGFVGFARWLMMPHESDDDTLYYLSQEVALGLVEALGLGDTDELAQMRQAIIEAAALREGRRS